MCESPLRFFDCWLLDTESLELEDLGCSRGLKRAVRTGVVSSSVFGPSDEFSLRV